MSIDVNRDNVCARNHPQSKVSVNLKPTPSMRTRTKISRKIYTVLENGHSIPDSKAPLNRTQGHRAWCTSIHIFSTDPHQHLLKRRIIHQQPVLPRTRPCAYLSRREPKGRVRTLLRVRAHAGRARWRCSHSGRTAVCAPDWR